MIHEITEKNFVEELEKGERALDEKFAKLDNLKNYDLSEKEFSAKAAWLFRDPTLWAYGTLKDRDNNPLKLHYFQDRFINDMHRFSHITAANQVGKTWAIVVKGLHHALHVNNGSVLLISSKEAQAKRILDEMKWMLKRTNVNFKPLIDEVENRFELHLKSVDGKGVSTITVFPPTEKILGYPSSLTLMDETGFWEKVKSKTPTEFYQQVVEPRSNAMKHRTHPFLTMGQIISISNPNGQSGLAWSLYKDPRFHNYRYCWLANPNNSLEEYLFHKNREDLSFARFASIYAATYVSEEGGFISLDQYRNFAEYDVKLAIRPQEDGDDVLYLGGDFASEDPKSKGTDWNVVYGVMRIKNKKFPNNPRIRLVYYKEWRPRTKRQVIYDEIERIGKLSGITIGKFAYDKVGVGDSVKRDLVSQGILMEGKIEPLTYSLPNKSDVFLNFQALFEQDLIEGKDIDSLKEQLLGLEVKKPDGSIHIKVHHKTDGVKDDHPDALANACYAAKVLGGSIASVEFVEVKPLKVESDFKKRGRHLLPCTDCGEYLWTDKTASVVCLKCEKVPLQTKPV